MEIVCEEREQNPNYAPGSEYTGSDIKFRKTAAMAQLGQKKESAEFCKKWLQKEPEKIIAACAGVYAFI